MSVSTRQLRRGRPRKWASVKVTHRMSYLNRLIKLSVPSRLHKRAAWLHFCHRCGADLSMAFKGKTLCEKCEAQDVD